MLGCGINPLGYSHHTEHLAAICILMDMPLLLTDEALARQLNQLYPSLQCQVVEWEDFDPNYLFSHFDVLFRSDIWDMRRMQTQFRTVAEQTGRMPRTVHCPHGWSDKTFWFEQLENEDIVLVYGQSMLDVLRASGALDRINGTVRIGNLRYQYYLQHREAFDAHFRQEVLCQFKKEQELILYAPTWYDQEQSSSFFDAAPSLIEGLRDDQNLLIKVHPALENQDIAGLYALIAEHGTRPNIVFLSDYPLVYPLLSAAQIYIGDTSSIGYDFLSFKRPMFFLDQNRRDLSQDRGAYLFRCGTVITPESYHDIHRIIAQTLPTDQERFEEQREQVYHYSFGQPRDWNTIREELERLIVGTRAI